MRGAVPINLPVPIAGWHREVPPHQLPANALRDGLNMLVDMDGVLATRGGYEPLSVQPDQTGVADPRIVAGIAFADTAGTQQVVIATLTKWLWLSGSPLSWVDISGNVFDSDVTVPTRMVVFGTPNNQTALFGVNGWSHDQLFRWLTGNPMGAFVTNTVVGGPTTLKADDMDVIADRLVLANVDDGQHKSDTVIWSDVLDGEAFHALSFNRLAGIGNLVAIRATSRTAGVVYGQTGAYIMYGVQGDNAGAFTFDRIESVTAGPINPNALVNVGGVHYYVGIDYHVWRCDGQSAQIVSGPIDAAIACHGRADFAVPIRPATNLVCPPGQLPVTLFDPTEQRVWFFVTFRDQPLPDATEALEPTQDARGALVLNLRTQAWEPPQRFSDAVTTAFTVVEPLAPTWNNPGNHGTTVLADNITDTQTSFNVENTSGFPVPGVVLIGSEWILYQAASLTSLLNCTRGAFGTTAASHSAGDLVTSEITWDDAPWPSWNAIPDQNDPAIWIATLRTFDPRHIEVPLTAKMQRFGEAPTDDGFVIRWNARWGLISSPKATQELQLNDGEVFLEPPPPPPAGDPPTDADDAMVTINVQQTVYDPAPVQILGPLMPRVGGQQAGFCVGNDPLTWQFRFPADIAVSAFKPGTWLDVTMSGVASHGGARYAGSNFYADVRQRPDRLRNVPGLSGGPTTQN